ncbi:MAG: STAS domain-containing protein [Oscillospiraceae bacterium]|nr:STAS domain-containing protein [Oscillospiraceae bacterium]
MKLSYTKSNDSLTVSITGEIDHHTAQSLLSSLSALLDTQHPLSIVLDFSGVGFMDSSGIAVILNCYRRMKELGGRLEVVSVANQARRVLAAAGLEKFLKISYT